MAKIRAKNRAAKGEGEMMDMLAACCVAAHQYCRLVIVRWRVAQVRWFFFLYFGCKCVVNINL